MNAPTIWRQESWAARLSQATSSPSGKVVNRNVSVKGERRSANRTSWTTQERGNGMHTGQDTSEPAEDLRAEPDAASEVWDTANRLQPTFAAIDRLVGSNIRRVQQAYADCQVGPHFFAGSTGYGHGDQGRTALDQVMAKVMGTEAAIVRSQFVSGTHAISTALFACLRPGDCLVAVAGRPYDTLEEVIGLRGVQGIGSLKDWGISYRENKLKADGSIDLESLEAILKTEGRKVALIQRSCGYSLRPTLSISDIESAISAIKRADPGCTVVVDNCYGEFTEAVEPGAVGADLVMGSLIKSPGGTIVTGGGYVAGREDLIAAVGARLTAPGVGLDAGCVDGETLRLMYQGLFLAPQMVGEAMKGGRLLAEVFQNRGLKVHPPPCASQAHTPVASFITAICLGTPAAMQAFCKAVQKKSPVGSYVLPVPGQTAGYGDEVIFADGTFIDGSTAELSADGPLREPYAVYCQGGTHWTHWAICLEAVLLALDERKD